VRLDEDGFLYFVGRMDEMIKTSGYRVSPAEIEETAFETGLVSEVAAIGLPHEQLGQAIVLVARPAGGEGGDADALIEAIRPLVPNYMVPAAVVWRDVLPRNANGKFDRRALAEEFEGMFA